MLYKLPTESEPTSFKSPLAVPTAEVTGHSPSISQRSSPHKMIRHCSSCVTHSSSHVTLSASFSVCYTYVPHVTHTCPTSRRPLAKHLLPAPCSRSLRGWLWAPLIRCDGRHLETARETSDADVTAEGCGVNVQRSHGYGSGASARFVVFGRVCTPTWFDHVV